MEIKDQIGEAMRLRNLSVRDVAREVGVCNQTVRYWLSGRMAPWRRHLPVLERLLGIHIDLSSGESLQLLARDERVFQAFPELTGVLKLDQEVRDRLLYALKVAARTTPAMASQIAEAAARAALAAEPARPGRA